MIYHDLDDAETNALMNDDETSWSAISAAILESQQGFLDTTLITGLWLADSHCSDDGSQFYRVQADAPVNTKEYVTYGTIRGREHCVEADSDHAITLFYRDQACRAGRNEYEEFSAHRPTQWRPRCLVVLIEPESRAALRDELVEAGRVLTQPMYARFLTHLNPAVPTPHITDT